MCFKFLKKTSRKEFSVSPRLWACASWMKIRYHVRARVRTVSAPNSQRENAPRQALPGTVVKASLTGLPHRGASGFRRTRSHTGSSLQLSQTRTGQPTPAETGWHTSQALTSVTQEETSHPGGHLQMATETKHKPDSR